MKIFKTFLQVLFIAVILSPTTIYAGYLSDGWAKRGSITFPVAGTGLPKVVTAANFDADIASYTYGNGSDLRFSSDSAGATPLAFHITYKHDPFSQVWINVPSGISKIYYWIGKPDADYLAVDDTYGSDNVWGSAKAVYLMNKEKAASFANDGTENPIGGSIMEPSAYYYNGKTYIVWQGDSLDPYITYYDHSTGSYATPVKVGTNPLTEDSHGNPAIMVDNSGYIHVFYGCHLTPMEYAKSTNTEDISAWTAQTDISDKLTYPHVRKLTDGTFVLIARWGNPVDYYSYRLFTSADSFATGTDIITVSSTDYIIYGSRLGYDQVNGRLWIAWCEYDRTVSERRNLYCAYYNLSDSHMYAYDGTDLGTEISAAERADCIILNSGTYQNNLPYLWLDADQYPHIIYSIEDAVGDYYHKYMYYNGSAWSSAETITEAGNVSNIGCAYFVGNYIEAYLGVNSVDVRGGNLEHWQRKGGVWSKLRTVFDHDDLGIGDGTWPAKRIEGAGSDDANIIFALGDESDFTNSDLPVFIVNVKDNFVYDSLTATAPSNLIDTTENTNHGTLTVAPTYTDSGKLGEMLAFNGTSEYCTLPSGIITDRTQYTFAGWVYIDGDSTNETTDGQVLLVLDNDMYVRLYWFEADDATNANQFRVLSYDGTTATNLYSSAHTAGSWYFITATFDSGNLILYVNGSSEDSASSVATPIDDNTPSRFGKDGTEIDRNWLYGKLDSWMIWNSALTGDEVLALYNNQTAPDSYPSATSGLESVAAAIIPQVIFY